MGFNMNWTQGYAANKNAQKANQNAQNATNAAIAAAMASQQASQASNNLMGSNLIITEMVSEMRDFVHRRFNDLVDANNRRADENQLILKKLDEQNEEIKDLHKKIAELQEQLYQEQEKNKGFTR